MLGITTVSAEPETVHPEEVDRSMLGKQIAVEGAVSNLSRYNQHAFFQVENHSSIEAVMFDYPGFLFNKEKVRMEGRVDLYEGSLQLVGSKIEVKN